MRKYNFKKIAAAALSFSIIAAESQSCPLNLLNTNAADTALSGDANNDGSVNISDAVTLQKYLLGKSREISANADMNNDNYIDIFDLKLLRSILQHSPSADSSALKINEVCSTNKNGITDSYNQHSDWIEIYNNSDSSISLNGYGLSDSENKLFKFTFPDVTIPAHDYLLIFATKDYASTDTELHAPFNISKNGETLYLSDALGKIIDTVEVPALTADTTYGRYNDGCDSFYTMQPTPSSANEISESSKIASPVFSHESGFYNNQFDLSITSENNYKIYYTTDGSVPTADSELFSGTLTVKNRTSEENVLSANKTATFSSGFGGVSVPSSPVTKSTVIKAIAVDENGKTSDVITKTYFVGIDQASQYNSLPIVSISMEYDDLFDYNKGIYTTGYYYDEYLKNGGSAMDNDWEKEANFTQRGIEWERPVHIDFFEGDGTLGFSQNFGVRIQGNASRANSQKSLKLYAREEYGKKKLEYDLIPGLKTSTGEERTSYKRFVLRNGANDINATKFRDPMLQELVSDRNFETQTGRPVIAFINGEYWGVYQMQDDYSNAYINEIYGYDKDEVVIIKNGETVEEGIESDFDDYKSMINFVRNNDMSIDSNYQLFCNMIDIQSLADFYASEIFINNQDVFAGTYINNIRMWKTRNVIDDYKGDGKWRFMLYDTEYSTDVYGVSYQQDLDAMIGALSDKFDTVIFAKTYKENENFRNLFINTIMDIGNYNFDKNKVNAAINKYVSLYGPVIDENKSRFSSGSMWGMQNSYQRDVDTLSSFFNNRLSKVISGLKNYYNVSTEQNITIKTNNSNLGCIKINSITLDLSSGSWTGTYFSDVPVTLTAIPNENSTFTGWNGDVNSTDATITVSLSKAITLTANFI